MACVVVDVSRMVTSCLTAILILVVVVPPSLWACEVNHPLDDPYSKHMSLADGNNSTRLKRQALKATVLWPGGVIPYEFAPGNKFNEAERFRIKEAMQLWEFGTCLKFRQATSTDKNKIRFAKATGCTIPMGMQDGVTTIPMLRCLKEPYSLTDAGRGWYLHKLGHVIGMIHTHQRPDRDQYIKLDEDVIEARNQHFFDKYAADKVDMYGIPYDFESIMHLRSKYKSNGGYRDSMITVDPSKQPLIYYVMYKWLSFYDIKLANLMYKCNKFCPKDPRCKSPGYLNKDCKCTCPNEQDCGYGVKYCPLDYQDPRCDEWFRKGDCDTSEGIHRMRMYCPRRCNCKNRWDETVCVSSAKQGDCTSKDKKTRDFMLGWCTKACNACYKEPKRSADCPRRTWIRTPPTNAPPPPTTRPPPPTTTKRTLGKCRNKESDRRCEAFWKRGDCGNNSWMGLNCPRSCNTCPGTCADIYGTKSCEKMKRNGDCVTREVWMKKHCVKTCNLCGKTLVCRDSNPSCQSWAKVGYCKTSATTQRQCRKSCGYC